ncbi:MAG: DMT family transporter [Pirellulaceae bacterium]|nr:DMT family transporter [Pirellulaceae bacterium]
MTTAVPPPRHWLFEPHLFGTICGLLSAVIYTAANAFLRSVMHCDPVWVSAVKALPTATLVFPFLVVLARRGKPLAPNWSLVGAIAAAGLAGQVLGNVSFQYALTVLGVALTVPLTLGGMIVAATLLGRIFLHEPVTLRAVFSLTLLLIAICVLSLGARDAGQSLADVALTPWQLASGVVAGCLSGLAYAVLNVVIRYTVLRGMPLPTTLFTVSLMGILALTTISLARLGGAALLATEPRDLALMLLAGVCNAVAFLALTKSLQLISVVYVNALNATQATLAAIAGVVLFGEALSPWLAVGVACTIAGLLIMTRGRKVDEIEVEP